MAETTQAAESPEVNVEKLDAEIKAAQAELTKWEKREADAAIGKDKARAAVDALLEQRGRLRRVHPSDAIRAFIDMQHKLRMKRAGVSAD